MGMNAMNVSSLVYAVNETNMSVVGPSLLVETTSSSSNHLLEIVILSVIVSCATITAIFCCIECIVERRHNKALDDAPPEARESKLPVHSVSPRITAAHSCTCRPGFECEDPENCIYPMDLDHD